MKKNIFFILIMGIIFANCGDDPPEPPKPPVDQGDTTFNAAKHVSRVVWTSGNEVNTTTYKYDANGRLSWISNTGNNTSFFEDTSSIERDASGKISKIYYSSDTSRIYPNDPNLDTVIFNVALDANGKYAYKLAQYKAFTTNFKDSTAYTYNAAGQIAKEERFFFDFRKTVNAYKRYGMNEYTYDAAGNLTNKKVALYDVNGVAGSNFNYEVVSTFDDKGVNLLNLGNDGIVIGETSDYSSKMVKTVTGTYQQDTKYNYAYTFDYKYNAKNFPLSADVTNSTNNTKGTLVFTYAYNSQ